MALKGWYARRPRRRRKEIDGPFEVEWTRFGFIWGPVHVERIGDTDTKRIGVYVTTENPDGTSVTWTCRQEDGGQVSLETAAVHRG